MKENIQKELAATAPLLAKQKRKPTPFKVPDLYFEQLEQQVLEQVKLPSTATPTVKGRSLSFWLSRIAAVLILAFGVLWLFQPTTTPEDLLADVSAKELNQYINDHLYEFDEDLLLEANTESADWQNQDFSKEEINLFLEDNLDDLDAEDLDYLL